MSRRILAVGHRSPGAAKWVLISEGQHPLPPGAREAWERAQAQPALTEQDIERRLNADADKRRVSA